MYFIVHAAFVRIKLMMMMMNATVRVSTDGQTHTRTHARTDAKRFYYLSHAICYSYGADNKYGNCFGVETLEFSLHSQNSFRVTSLSSRVVLLYTILVLRLELVPRPILILVEQ